MSKQIDDIRQVVETMHKCKAVHEGSAPIRETLFRRYVVWEGMVESFALIGHPKAKRCYGFRYEEAGYPGYAAVLELPPVASPLTAVRAWMIAEVKKRT